MSVSKKERAQHLAELERLRKFVNNTAMSIGLWKAGIVPDEMMFEGHPVIQGLPPDIAEASRQIFISAYFAGVESLAKSAGEILDRHLVSLLPPEQNAVG